MNKENFQAEQRTILSVEVSGSPETNRASNKIERYGDMV